MNIIDCLFLEFVLFLVFSGLVWKSFDIMIDCLNPFGRFYTVFKVLIVAICIALTLLLGLPFYKILVVYGKF